MVIEDADTAGESETATADETLADLLDRSGRASVPIRRTFLQLPDRSPGPLAAFVSGRRSLALDLWLLQHAGASGGDWDVRQPAMSWARMLDMPQTTASETTISRNWSWLEERQLIRTVRDRRVRKVILLREDGSGRAFERATGQERGFFKLPYSYFTERIHRELRLAAKATLLICLSQGPTFTLPTERAGTWYGISPDTLERGIDELKRLELIKAWPRRKKAPRTRLGFTIESHYALLGPFARPPARRRSRGRIRERRRPRHGHRGRGEVMTVDTVVTETAKAIDAALAGTVETFVSLPAVDLPMFDAFRAALDAFQTHDTPAGRAAAKWLRESALLEHLTSRTTVVLGRGRVLAYYSLASAHVDLNEADRVTAGVRAERKRVPATLMVWIDRDPVAETSGGELLLHAAARARRAHPYQATAVMVLEAFDAETARMWLARPYPLHPLEGRKSRLFMALPAKV